MNLERFFDIISSLGTVGAAVIAAISIGVIRKQNRSQYRPRMTISRGDYKVFLDEENFGWAKVIIGQRDPDDAAKLSILNIGNGIATNIVVHWDYDIKKMIDMCNSMKSHVDRSTKYVDAGNYINIEKNGEVDGMFISPKAAIQRIDYISPVNIEKEGKAIEVDFALQQLSLARALQFGEEQSESVFQDLDQSFNLRIKFLDSLGNRYDEKIPVRLRVGIWKAACEEEPAYVLFSIDRVID